MDGVSSFSIFLMQAIIALFAFFVVAPMILNAISMFGVMRDFSEAMIREGVIPREEVEMIQPKKELAGVIISLVVTIALIVVMIRNGVFGIATGSIGMITGALKFRRIVQYNSLTVKRFRDTYKDVIDTRKFDRFVRDHF